MIDLESTQIIRAASPTTTVLKSGATITFVSEGWAGMPRAFCVGPDSKCCKKGFLEVRPPISQSFGQTPSLDLFVCAVALGLEVLQCPIRGLQCPPRRQFHDVPQASPSLSFYLSEISYCWVKCKVF